MRKISILLILIFVILAGNFILWFSHTRVVRGTLADVQKELKYYRVKMNYDDLYFNNFKAWNVDGVIENLTVRLDRYLDAKIVFSRVNFISEPFKQNLELRADGDIFLITNPGTENEHNYKINYVRGYPSIEVSFKSSLGDFGGKLHDSHDSIIDELHSIVYYDSGFIMHDLDSNSDYLEVENVKASVITEKEAGGKNYKLLFKYDGMNYLDDYHSAKEDSVIDTNNKKTGKNAMNIDFSILYLPKNMQKEQTLKHAKKGLSDGRFDTLKFKFNDISIINAKYGISASGTLKKRVGILMPKLDIVFTFSNYDAYIKYVIDNFNYLLNNHPETQALLPYKPFSPTKVNSLSDFFSRYEVNSHDVRFRINSAEDGFKINEQSLLHFMMDLQEIFIAPEDKKTKNHAK